MPLTPPWKQNDWSADIASSTAETRNCKIVVYLENSTGAFDVVVPERAARMQPLSGVNSINGTVTKGQSREVLFEQEIDPSDPPLLPGMFVRVIEAGNDHNATEFVYTIEAALNSGQAALRSIFTVTNLAVAPAVS